MSRSVKPLKSLKLSKDNDRLESLLEKLAVQIVTRAAKVDKTGVSLVPLGEQISALKAAGTFWGLTRKHTQIDDEGGAWGELSDRLAAGADEEEDGEADTPARH